MVTPPDTRTLYAASCKIDHLLDPRTAAQDRLVQLCRAMLTHQGTDARTLTDFDAVSHVFSPNESGKNQRFYAAVFLRLLSTFPSAVHNLDTAYRVGVTKLLDQLPQVSKALRVDRSSQAYERLRAFEPAASTVEESLSEALTAPTSLATFHHVRHRVMRVYNKPLVGAIVKPFLPDFLSKHAISRTLGILHDYASARDRLRMTKYLETTAALADILNKCEQYDTFYVRHYFRPFFLSLRRQLRTDFESSPLNQPASLSLTDLGRKYPFAVPDADVRLTFAVENKSEGTALDAELSIEIDDCLSPPSRSQFLDQIDAGERLEPVEFRAKVVIPTEKPVLILWTLTWQDGDGSSETSEGSIELQAQRSDIPWDALQYAQPYSLEPVTTADELIGRSEQTTILISKLRAPNVESFCIYGQRRVGKTSVVTTLEDMPELQNVTILNLQTGEFIVPDAQETINTLGQTICTALLTQNSRLTPLKIPQFAGALTPLTGFLTAAFDRDPSLRLVIVLDEFDELPPELHRRGNVSHAFFMTLRSLSAKPQLGFILVGGEGMDDILRAQGQVLNKFRVLRIDYLEKASHWSDFVKLVRKPVNKWATITDGAITTLYNVTAGNPFFTNLVCGKLVEDMIMRRDAYATPIEMEQAIRTTVNQAGTNHFQHFWKDGVVATSDENIEPERVLRRRVLLSLGEALRAQDRGTVEDIANRASRFALGEAEIRRVLGDFERRKVLVRAEGEYGCKVRLFERWLVDKGVDELDLTLVEEESLRRRMRIEEELRVKNQEVHSLVTEWGTYRGRQITDGAVKGWLSQFDTTEERRLVFELLRELRFFSRGVIRERLKEAHDSVRRRLAARGVARRVAQDGARKVTDNILISFYGGEGKRGQSYAKLYADENNIYVDRIVAPERLRKKLEGLEDVEGIVFVDDFIGTGRTAKKSLEKFLPRIANLIERSEIDIFVISVSGFARGAESVEGALSNLVRSLWVSVCEPLIDSDKCFSEQSEILPDPSKRARTKEIVESYGRKLVKGHPLGYGNGQALVVFEDTCPNNSLPILWAARGDSNWQPLFSRP